MAAATIKRLNQLIAPSETAQLISLRVLQGSASIYANYVGTPGGRGEGGGGVIGLDRYPLFIHLFSDSRRGCYMGLSMFIFFFLFSFFFPPRFCLAHISGTVTRRDS